VTPPAPPGTRRTHAAVGALIRRDRDSEAADTDTDTDNDIDIDTDTL
jgi:hypothetical protein